MAATYEPIASVTLGSTSTSVTFSSIPATYTDLVVACSARFGSASGSRIRFNSDTATNYSSTYLLGQGSAASSGRLSSVTSIRNNHIWGDATVANQFTPYGVSIHSYSSTSVYKTALWTYGTGGGLQGSNSETGKIVGLWRSTAAITTIEFAPFNATSYQIGSTFSLFGIKAAA